MEKWSHQSRRIYVWCAVTRESKKTALKRDRDEQRAAERGTFEPIWLLAFLGFEFHFLSSSFCPQSFNLNPASAVSKQPVCISCKDWLFLKLLHFLVIAQLLTLVLFSRSACTSFWDLPRSRYFLSQRENIHIMIVPAVEKCVLVHEAVLYRWFELKRHCRDKEYLLNKEHRWEKKGLF